jgi:hypothetical protein
MDKMFDDNHLVVIALKGLKVATQRSTKKIKRDAFLYLDSEESNFAQCETCWLFVAGKQRCAILGPDFKVDADDSCNFYLRGKYTQGIPVAARVTPEEAGFVDRKVRCENCRFGGEDCQLYVTLNQKMPDVFDLETKIKPTACCNANTSCEGATQS